jgi:MFS family permease
MLTSIVSGRIISKIGRYRIFPIIGTLVTFIAMALLGTLKIETPIHVLYMYIALLGFGLGMVMQVLVLAVQNSVEQNMIGVATSSTTLFRQIGGSIGVAGFGAIFTNVLQNKLIALIPPGVELPHQLGAKAVHELPAALQNDYLQAFGAALHSVYLISACVVILAFVLSLLMKDVPLRK